MCKPHAAIISILIVFLYSCTPGDNTKTIIPFRCARRLPDKLEYYYCALDSSDKNLLETVLKDHNANYFKDKDNNFYIDASTNFGDGVVTYYWIITDDFLAAKNKKRNNH